MGLSKKIINVAAGLLLKDHKVLVVQKQNNQWGFPNGNLEPDESYEQALQREFKDNLSESVVAIEEVAGVEIEESGSVMIISFFTVQGELEDIKLTVYQNWKMVDFVELQSLELADIERKMINNNIESIKKLFV